MFSLVMLGTDAAVDHFVAKGQAVIGTDFSLALLEGATDGDESNLADKDAVQVPDSPAIIELIPTFGPDCTFLSLTVLCLVSQSIPRHSVCVCCDYTMG